MAAHVEKPDIKRMPVEDYLAFRSKIRSGDIFFCSGNYLLSRAIRKLERG